MRMKRRSLLLLTPLALAGLALPRVAAAADAPYLKRLRILARIMGGQSWVNPEKETVHFAVPGLTRVQPLQGNSNLAGWMLYERTRGGAGFEGLQAWARIHGGQVRTERLSPAVPGRFLIVLEMPGHWGWAALGWDKDAMSLDNRSDLLRERFLRDMVKIKSAGYSFSPPL